MNFCQNKVNLSEISSVIDLPILVFNIKTNKLLFANESILKYVGRTDFKELEIGNIVSDEDFGRFSALAAETCITGEKTFLECHILTTSDPMFVHIRCYAMKDDKDAIVCTVVNADETELMRSYHEICLASFASISGTMSGGIFKLDWCDGHIVYVDRAIQSKDYEDVCNDVSVHDQIKTQWIKGLSDGIESGKKSFKIELPYTRSNGVSSNIRFDIYLLRQFGKHKHFICFYEETDEIKLSINKLTALKTRFQLLLENSLDTVFEYNYITDKVTYINSDTNGSSTLSTFEITNFRNYFYGNLDVFICSPEIARDFFAGKAVLGEEIHFTRKLSGVEKDQWFVLKSKIVNDVNGKPLEAVGTLHDITAEKLTQIQLEKKMKTDSLTGFLNYKAFCTDSKIAAAKLDENSVLAVATFKINNIAILNEQLGVLFGDTVIKNLAAKISTSFSANAILGRISGSSFSVTCCNLKNEDELFALLETVHDSFCRIFTDVNTTSKALLKIGVAISQPHTEDFETLLFKSKVAILAQDNTDNKYECFTQSMSELYNSALSEPESNNPDVVKATMDDMTSEMCMMLISTPDTDAAITACLAFLGEHYGVSRAYIYERVENSNYITCSYEWCANGVKSYKKQLQNVPIANPKRFDEVYSQDMLIVNNPQDVADVIPLAVETVLNLALKSSSLQFPINQKGTICGFIGFDKYGRNYIWSHSEKTKLMTLCGFIGNQIAKLRSQIHRILEHNLLASVISHMDLDVYSVNPLTHELLYTNFGGKVQKDDGGKKCYEVFKKRKTPCSNCPMLGLSNNNSSYSMKVFDEIRKSWMDVTAFPTLDYYGRKSVVIAWHDISNYGQLLADTDELTASPMFNMFMPKVELITSQFPSDEFVMIYLNCKKLRIINESYSFAMGNKLLIAVSKTIGDRLSEKETFARISADKFVIFKERKNVGNSVEDFTELLEKFRHSVYMKLDEAVSLSSINFNVGIYIPSDNYISVSDMLDKSCIAAKVADTLENHSNIFIYNQDLLKNEERIAFIESRMQTALDSGEFKLYLQPKFNLKTGELSGAEALSRWVMADGQFVMPGDFIPVFEKNGFVTKLDFSVYENVLKKLREWIDGGNDPILVSVNVSRAHINDVSFDTKLMALLEKYDIKPSMLELELTETMFVENSEQMINFIENLHNLGFVISIDDFGSGYSSLNLLKDMSIDVLKIDKSMFGKGENSRERPLLEGVISMAKNMNMETICEGVETEKQVEFLREIECDFAQGFLYQKPIPVEIFEQKYTKTSRIVQ